VSQDFHHFNKLADFGTVIDHSGAAKKLAHLSRNGLNEPGRILRDSAAPASE
jgi:hypothetical protein